MFSRGSRLPRKEPEIRTQDHVSYGARALGGNLKGKGRKKSPAKMRSQVMGSLA